MTSPVNALCCLLRSICSPIRSYLCDASTYAVHYHEMPMLLLTGCPRSGTGYAARIFQAQGLDIGHEQVGTDGVSSWLFAVLDRHYPWHQRGELRQDYNFKVILHQVRDPLKVLASMAVLRRPDWTFIGRHLNLPPGSLARRISFYLQWTQICDRQAHYRYRVEDFQMEWPHLHRLCGGTAQWTGAAQTAPTHYNRRRHSDLTWDQILATPGGADVAAKAQTYGYGVSVSTC